MSLLALNTTGVPRYQCRQCNFDVCDLCLAGPFMHHNHPHSLSPCYQPVDWICNGIYHPGGCKRGITGFGQSRGVPRFHCAQCNYNLCDKCIFTPYVPESFHLPGTVHLYCPHQLFIQLSNNNFINKLYFNNISSSFSNNTSASKKYSQSQHRPSNKTSNSEIGFTNQEVVEYQSPEIWENPPPKRNAKYALRQR